MDQLTANLLDLLFELQGRSIPIMIGGGFGLFLKRRHLETTGQQTLFFHALPELRATNDLDMFLRADLLSDLGRTQEVRAAILRLGYTPVEEAKFLQWKRSVLVSGVSQEVKIDVLVGPLGEYRPKLKVSMPRVRPKGDIEFHAHAVEEAVLLERNPVTLEVAGRRSSGEPYTAVVEVPDAFPYLMMKLHAFSDRKGDANKDLGRHHALDVYPIVGMMTESEYDRARQAGSELSKDKNFERARAIVGEHFSTDTATGVLRMREHRLFRPNFQLELFRQVLQEIFPHGK
jgi:hypothetical protein